MSKKNNQENEKVHGRAKEAASGHIVEVVPPSPKSEASLREEAVLAFWEEHDIFKQTLETPASGEPKGEFVFYDGPPFATGLPHYGHILAGTIKDAIPRFWTMRGYRVRRKWGWDCHGLPLENLIEKKLGLATKRDIESYGVKNFNEAAREAVLEYADDWKRIVPRMGRFVDMEDDYKTMDSTYTESVWWVFSELNRKGLLYEGFKSMHLCPRCGTTLSNFEVNQGYKDIKDIAVTVKLPLLDEAGAVTDTSLLVWTTTPWTLPGNMAAAVHNDFEYAKVKLAESGEHVLLAKGRLVQLGDVAHEVVAIVKGSDLVGRSYQPPFAYWQDRLTDGKEQAWKIYHADYVELGEEGTGAVHLAPAYGEDDMQLAKQHGVPIVHHVSQDGHFMDFVTDFAGRLVKPKDDDQAGVSHLDADIEVLKKLQEAGKIFKKENITHSYPHCWRCDTPLLNYATNSWFVRVTDIRDRLVKENSQVRWVPEHVGQNRFGRWLEGARDWAISRQRYWGAPLPAWRNPQTGLCKIFGSLAELQEYVPKSGNTYFMMRHAEAESNLTGVINAVADEKNALTDKGRQQCLDAVQHLQDKQIDLIIHSGIPRTRDTALAVAEALGVPADAILEDARMTELQAGTKLEGMLWSDYEAQYSNDEERFTKKIAGVENRYDVQKRTGAFLYDLEATYQQRNILIVGHASSTFALRSVAEGADMAAAQAIREEGYLQNAEVRALPFVPLPHNDLYQLDYHRPYIDELPVVDVDGTPLERVPDVFDCWFESGSMPYAATHYPFENLDVANPAAGVRFPANFISESVDQTRGWFYSLMVLGVGLFDKAPFQNVITNGLVLAEDGKKMSKSLNNYPDPMELADRVGVDAMRYYLLSSSIIRGEDLNFSEKEVAELQRKNNGRLHNVLAMYEMFAGEDVEAKSDPVHVLDRWIVARLNQLVSESTTGYENYELDKATRPMADFIDDLSVWYLRRSRDRFKGEDALDKALALGTLRHVLKTLALVMAPVMPFYADYLWGRVKTNDEPLSVHLAAWPESGEVDAVVLGEMSLVREFVTIAFEARSKVNIKVRQPLSTLRINIELEPEYAAIVADEINVKAVVSDTTMSERAVLDQTLTPELIAEGAVREFMRGVQDARKAANLVPADRVVLTVATSPEGEAVLEQFRSTILKTVGATEIVFGAAEGGTEIRAGEHVFTTALQVTD